MKLPLQRYSGHSVGVDYYKCDDVEGLEEAFKEVLMSLEEAYEFIIHERIWVDSRKIKSLLDKYNDKDF